MVNSLLIFPRRSLEPRKILPYKVLLESEHITRLYLDELGEVDQIPLGLGLIKLIVEGKRRTPKLIKNLINKTRSEIPSPLHRQKVLDLIETIVLYKLPFMSREELAAMYTFTKEDLRKTRYYQDVRQEAREELAEEVRESVTAEVRESVTAKTRQEEALQLVQRLISRRLGAIAPDLDRQVKVLETSQLENLAEALLDIHHSSDLATWLESLDLEE